MRVYAGRDGRFTLYNDAGDGYTYEKGEYTALKIMYCDETGEIREETEGVDTFRRNVGYRMIGRKRE